jgi:hypothetical protein
MSRLAPHDDPSSLGRILLDANIISVRQLSEGVAFALSHDKLLGEALCELGYINEASLQAALEAQGARRAARPRERAARTIGLMQSASAHASSAIDRLDTALARADAVVRRFAVRRKTGGA